MDSTLTKFKKKIEKV